MEIACGLALRGSDVIIDNPGLGERPQVAITVGRRQSAGYY